MQIAPEHLLRDQIPHPFRPVSGGDAELTKEIIRVHTANLGVYGVRKVWNKLKRKGTSVARCTVERLMRAAGLRRISREKTHKTTISAGAETPRPAEKVNRQFVATAPNQLWVADLTYIRSYSGWVYATFHPRRLLKEDRGLAGVHKPAHRPRPRHARDGLMGTQRAGQEHTGLVHHSYRGIQYAAIHYTEQLAKAEAVASVGSKGDSYDNAMAEALNSLFKAQCIRNPVMRGSGWRGSGWRCIDDVELAVATYIDWYNHRRLHSEIGYLPPAEYRSHPVGQTPRSTTILTTESSPRPEPTNRASIQPGAIHVGQLGLVR